MYGRQEYFDAHLTEFGWQQVDGLLFSAGSSVLADHADQHATEHMALSLLVQASQLADYVDKHKIKREVDVVIVSPLSRALETAVGAFGGSEVTSGSGSVLMQSLKAEEVSISFTAACSCMSPLSV